MHNFPTSPFHRELYSYLLSDVNKRIEEGDVAKEKEFAEYREHLKSASSAEDPHSFVDMLETYQKLISEKKSQAIEKKIMDAIPLDGTNIKIYRGLPRLYNKENPSVSFIKAEFAHVPSLKQLIAEHLSLSQYENAKIPKEANLCFFTYMLPDGWGDLIAAKESIRVLKNAFPNLSIRSIVCVPKSFSLKEAHFDLGAILISYDEDCPLSHFPKEAMRSLQSSDLIVSLPTHYPHMEELKRELSQNKWHAPKILSIGQYGFIESEWFHPKSGNYSMGLHFLEKGILTRNYSAKPDFRALQNETLLYTLFGTKTPQSVDIENYLTSTKFYLAYLLTPIGGAIYLHALLQKEAKENKTIDICTPDIGWLISYIKKQAELKRPFLEGDFNISEIEVHFDGKVHTRSISEKGKKVRILCPGPVSDSDFRNLIRLSEEFVAVRGDQSFSEAVSANRLFYYDGAPHARYFVKDLVALAQNRIAKYPASLHIFQNIGKAFLHNISHEGEEWVDETYFQEKTDWTEIAKGIGAALQNQKVVAGFKKFNQIVTEEYSFNKTLCRMVQKALCSKMNQ